MKALRAFAPVRRLERKLGGLYGVRRISDAWPQGVISFTFDDFPKTALTVGGDILERYGARGTYYTAAKLAGTEGDLGRLCDPDDIRTAHRKGHEIACHSFSHLDCSAADRPSLKAEVRANAAALSAMIGPFAPANFAFPFGAQSERAKRILMPHFHSCRGIRPGLNQGIPDIAELSANSVYAVTFDEKRMRDLMDRNAAVAGWLIFYSHDVCENPSPYGCKPEQLEALVAYAAKSAPVRPVRDVISSLNL